MDNPLFLQANHLHDLLDDLKRLKQVAVGDGNLYLAHILELAEQEAHDLLKHARRLTKASGELVRETRT